ncbi:MAG TPA: outer membrane beta-barrel protein, partial [Lacibacter sp.]|nr:outer membrane beta-barrel protein [Lacibacter sp.]
MLKDKADEYKMYPSQQSWENIQKRIQPKSRLFNFKSIGLSAALLLGFAISISDEQTTKEAAGSFAASLLDGQELPVTATTAKNTAKVIPITAAIRTKPVSQELSEPFISNAVETPSAETIAEPNETTTITSAEEEMPSLKKATIAIEPTSLIPSLTGKPNAVEVKAIDITAPESTISVEPDVTDAVEGEGRDVVPVVKSPKLPKQLQFYIASSASYRVLYNDNKLTFGNILQQDPEKVAKHSPSVGVEFGAAVLLPLSKNINFRTGIQLNYTRYNVEVFKTTPQVATVILNNNTAVIQRVTSLNSQNNNGLSKSSEVANETYQLSLPLGFEFRLAGKRKLQWNLATNVQPTYLISASGYMLTNNYEKYIKAPDLLSNLNLNSSLETFLRWNVKDVQMQAGPQLRYQIFSNSQEGYPIKEHLVDYGFRIGIVKTIK